MAETVVMSWRTIEAKPPQDGNGKLDYDEFAKMMLDPWTWMTTGEKAMNFQKPNP